jgi:hypothetical protein
MRYFNLNLAYATGASIGNNATATVVFSGTNAPAALFSDQYGASPLANPINPFGGTSISFWVVDGVQQYDIILTGDNLPGAVKIPQIWSLPGPTWQQSNKIWQFNTDQFFNLTPVKVSTKTTANVGLSYTGYDIIRAAMRLIQVSAVDVDLTANELQDGLESLNRMLDAWSIEELMLYHVTRETFTLQPGKNPYTIGRGGDWNTDRPAKIIDAYFTLSAGAIPVDYPMRVIGYDDYNAIRLKTLSTNFPGYLYYEAGFPLGTVYVYPISAIQEPITITSWKPFSLISDPAAYMAFPPGYWEAIVFNLAVRIAEEYQFDMRATTVTIAQNALRKIKRMNQRTVTLQTDVALMNQSQMRYNIYSDGYGR